MFTAKENQFLTFLQLMTRSSDIDGQQLEFVYEHQNLLCKSLTRKYLEGLLVMTLILHNMYQISEKIIIKMHLSNQLRSSQGEQLFKIQVILNARKVKDVCKNTLCI